MGNTHLAVGVFDSGIGGLTVLAALREVLPREDFVYLGDTARVPYGTRSAEVVRRYAMNNARFLSQQGIKLLVVACNTATAVALDALRAALPVPVVGVVDPGVKAALSAVGPGAIAVLGTAGTIASNAYGRAIATREPGREVLNQQCPLFVPLAEEGLVTGPIADSIAEYYLHPLRGRVGAAILGCTHYPLLRAAIQRALGSEVLLIDSAGTTAAEVAATLEAAGLIRRVPGGTTRFFLTDTGDGFRRVGERFLGAPIDPLEHVDISGG